MKSKTDVVDFALRTMASEALDLDQARRLRGSGWEGDLDELLAEEIATCQPVRMELFAGAGDEQHLRNLRGLLARATTLETLPTDYEDAATIYRACRRRGETVRKLIDCLIAAHAIRARLPLLHADADFDALARHTRLTLDRA